MQGIVLQDAIYCVFAIFVAWLSSTKSGADRAEVEQTICLPNLPINCTPCPPLPPSFHYTGFLFIQLVKSFVSRIALCLLPPLFTCRLIVALSTDGFNMALLCLPHTHTPHEGAVRMCVSVCPAIVNAINPKPSRISQAEAARCATWLTTWLQGNFIALSASLSLALSLLLPLSLWLSPLA